MNFGDFMLFICSFLFFVSLIAVCARLSDTKLNTIYSFAYKNLEECFTCFITVWHVSLPRVYGIFAVEICLFQWNEFFEFGIHATKFDS